MGLPKQGLEFLLRGQKMGRPPLLSTIRNSPGLLRLLSRERQLTRQFDRDLTTLFEPAIAQLETVDPETLTLIQLRDRITQIREWLVPITYYNILGPIGLAIRKALFKVPEEWLQDCALPELTSLRSLAKLGARLRKIAPENATLDRLADTLESSAELRSDFTRWLETYGYLSEAGTDIAVPTWRDRPEPLLSMLLAFAQPSKFQPEASESASDRPTSPLQRWRLQRVLPKARTQAKIAEIYAKLLAHLRWTFLAIERQAIDSRQIQQAGDIFFLELGEIERWIAGDLAPNVLRTCIDRRRQQLESDRHRQVPTVVYGNRLPQDRDETFLAERQGVLQGIPASGGCVEGVVKVCRTFRAEPLSPDTILVVPYTDAGWAPLLANASAIVAEVGGQLSHGAIVAREFGIPAVMNVSEAIAQLRDGQRVRVDGDRGTVEICS